MDDLVDAPWRNTHGAGEDRHVGVAGAANGYQAREAFPAVYHFWRRLPQLEQIFAAPVMVEFTGVHGTFTILQVNEAGLDLLGRPPSEVVGHPVEAFVAEVRQKKYPAPEHCFS